MINKQLSLSIIVAVVAIQSAYAEEEFKRFSVSAGWIRIIPQGKATQFNINTAVSKDRRYDVGAIKPQTLSRAIDESKLLKENIVYPPKEKDKIQARLPASVAQAQNIRNMTAGYAEEPENDFKVPGSLAGDILLGGVDQWQQPHSGLEARTSDTLGLMANYNFTDNITFQLIAGIPPKVKIRGRGKIIAKAIGVSHPGDAFSNTILPIKQELLISDLDSVPNVAQARAWTPAFEIQYVFGKSGVNKFRPFIGIGAVYAKFTHIKLNKDTKRDLVIAGHMVQNILDGKVGDSVEKYNYSSADIKVKVKSTDELAPIATVGFTYDITPTVFATASLSFSKINTRTEITAKNMRNGQTLTAASTRLDIDPVVTYVGVGYRF